jgi:hypothetical protein
MHFSFVHRTGSLKVCPNYIAYHIFYLQLFFNYDAMVAL